MRLYKVLNSRISWTVSSIILFSVLTIIVWSINKGMIFSDEAYYLFRTLPDLKIIGNSYWHIIYSPFIFENFIITKLLLVIIIGVSAYFMGNVTAKYLELPISPVLVGIWCVIAQFILISPSGYSPNYMTINSIIFNLIIVFLSLFMTYKKRVYLIFLGFFFASLTFVMITNNILVFPLLAIIYLSDKGKFWINCLWIFLGIISLQLVYFIFLQGIREFYNGIIEAMEYMDHDKTHGPKGMIIWHYHFIRDFLIAVILLLIAFSKLYKIQIVKYILFGISVIYSIYLLYGGVTHKFAIFPTLIFYFIAGWLLVIYLKGKREYHIKFWFCILLLILPYFASFGTDVNLFIRSTVYFPFILIGSLYLGLSQNSLTSKFGITIFLSVFFLATLTFFSYPFRSNWEGYKLVEQTEKFEGNGYTIFLDKYRFNNLKEIYPHLNNERNVLTSYPRAWGYVFNSGATPPYLYYRPNEFTINYIKGNDIPLTELKLLEDKSNPFDDKFINKLLEGNFTLRKIELSNYNIYEIETGEN